MSKTSSTLKRKAITRDAPESNEAALVDELGNTLNGFDSEAQIMSDGASDDEDKDEDDQSYDSSDNDQSESPDELLAKRSGTTNYRIVEDANGNPRFVYKDIDPVYDSDDSDAPQGENTIGNIPLSFYDSYPHIGYDINGKKVMRPAKGNALDSLLDSIDIPEGWTGLTDPATGKPLELSEGDLDVLKRLTRNEIQEDGYDPYPEMVEYFTGVVEPMPLSSAPEPKRRFVPSKHEHKRIMKMVKAIKEGRIQPYKPPAENDEDDEDEPPIDYDIWADAKPRPDHPMNIPAPKLPPPGYEESYHPPPEYVPDEEELKKWNETDEEEREKQFLPKDHTALRKVAGYDRFLKEKFERCLDLYLAPRVRRNKLNIDPESLLPKLPSIEELRPYPSSCNKVFRGHKGRVHSLAIDPTGDFLATGGSDGYVRLWTLRDGKMVWEARLADDDPVHVVRWRPGESACVLAAAAGEYCFLIVPQGLVELDDTITSEGKTAVESGFSVQQSQPSTEATKEPVARWMRPSAKLRQSGVLVQIAVRSVIKQIAWHRRGGHFATVAPRGGRRAISIHTLPKHQTQLPFRRLKGLAQAVQFHPSKPVIFVATQRLIRSYDLAKQVPLKTLQPGARWISGFDVHPGGENLLVGAYDRRLLWMDTELSDKPYRVLRYHDKAVRATRFHPGGWPLFADASDDGTVQIFHGKVVGDLMQNATIVPIRKLLGHDVTDSLGVLDLDWHPTEPWVVSAGADGTCRLWK